MEQKLFTEIIPLYRSRKDNPYTIRIRIRLQDAVDPVVLRRAVDTTMERYPYFCVKLQTRMIICFRFRTMMIGCSWIFFMA